MPIEDEGGAFDPETLNLTLSKEEKRRTTALFLAINAYDKLIIKTADYYIAACREHDRNPEIPPIQPATIDAMVEAAIKFDTFIENGSQKEKEKGGAND